MNDVKLSLLVLKTHQLERLKDFYTAVGISFAKEKHGDGPLHLAARIGDVVIEFHPLDAEPGPANPFTRTAKGARSLKVLAKLGAAVVSGPRVTEWGRRAVVKAPDGRKVEVVQG